MGGEVGSAPACMLRQPSGFVSRHLSKIQNGRHKNKEWPTHSSLDTSRLSDPQQEVMGSRLSVLLTINVPLFKKLRDIIFFWWDNHFMSHFEGHFEGAKTFLTP